MGIKEFALEVGGLLGVDGSELTLFDLYKLLKKKAEAESMTAAFLNSDSDPGSDPDVKSDSESMDAFPVIRVDDPPTQFDVNDRLLQLPAASSYRLAPIDNVRLIRRPSDCGGYPEDIVVVSGLVPCFNLEVRLSPFIYVQEPEYWVVEAVIIHDGIPCLPAVRQYEEYIDRYAANGTKGIEIVGAGGSVRIDWEEVLKSCEGGAKKQ